MVEVIAFPPVKYTARSQGLSDVRSVSRGITGTPYVSQYMRARRVFSVTIDASECGLGFSGYLEEMRRRQDTKTPLVQIEVRPDAWHFDINAARDARGHGEILWSYTGEPMEWLYTAMHLNIFYSGMDVVAGSDYGGYYIDVVAPKPNSIIAYAGEEVTQDGLSGRVMSVSRSDETGASRIYVDTEFQTGHVQISHPKWAMAYIDDMPSPQQDTNGGFEYTLSMTEVFEDEYPDGFTVIQPWR